MDQGVNISEQVSSEEAQIQRAKSDSAAFRPLYQKYYKPIFRFVYHRLGDRDETADVTSQVFVKALVNLSHYTFRGLPFSSWLFRIAVNECNSYFRKHKRARTVVLEEYHVQHLYEEMFGDEFQEELRRKLPLVLERLSADEMHLIELRFLEGRAFKEVADILNITETYAKVKTYRVLDKMKKLFTGR